MTPRLYGDFDEGEYHVAAFLPEPGEPPEWSIKVTLKGEVVREQTIPLQAPDLHGADPSDQAALDLATDELIEELVGTEEDCE